MTRIILVRHGHVEGIAPERFRGHRDVDLSELGVRQARATAQRIAAQWQPVTAYTSPRKRCVQTITPIAASCNISPVVLNDLDDVHYGDWEWCTHEAVRAQWPALYERWLKGTASVIARCCCRLSISRCPLTGAWGRIPAP